MNPNLSTQRRPSRTAWSALALGLMVSSLSLPCAGEDPQPQSIRSSFHMVNTMKKSLRMEEGKEE